MLDMMQPGFVISLRSLVCLEFLLLVYGMSVSDFSLSALDLAFIDSFILLRSNVRPGPVLLVFQSVQSESILSTLDLSKLGFLMPMRSPAHLELAFLPFGMA